MVDKLKTAFRQNAGNAVGAVRAAIYAESALSAVRAKSFIGAAGAVELFAYWFILLELWKKPV
ncbi:MAG: hypothetical protein AB7F23_02660 [Phycisphaerae bacterium]|jgi:hypothetical protein